MTTEEQKTTEYNRKKALFTGIGIGVAISAILATILYASGYRLNKGGWE